MMAMEKLAREYLSAFARRDIKSLENTLSESVKLRDWNQAAEGIHQVVKVNEDLFKKFGKVEIDVKNTHSDGDTVVIEFDLILQNSDEKLEIIVTDIIQFNSDLKISEIRAYRGN